MNISMNEINDVTVVEIDGKIIYETEKVVKDKIELLFETGKIKIVMNLNKLTYINSSGLGMLIALLKKARSIGGDVTLSCLTKDIKELFRVTSLDNIFKIADTDDDALNLFS